MIFFTQKVLRKEPGGWTFVLVTDRRELDRQLYGEFKAAGAITGREVQATSSAHLRELLAEDHRYVSTLIHKFRTADPAAPMDVLSDRRDVVIITDEAHRSRARPSSSPPLTRRSRSAPTCANAATSMSRRSPPPTGSATSSSETSPSSPC